MSFQVDQSLSDGPSFIPARNSDMNHTYHSSDEQHKLLGRRGHDEVLEEPQAEPENSSKLKILIQHIRETDQQNSLHQQTKKTEFISMKPATAAFEKRMTNLSDDDEDDEQEEDRRCTMRQESRMRISWDIFVIVLALWNVYFIPLNIALSPPFGSDPGVQAFNYLIDFLFFMDIVLNFRTTYLDSDGDEIFLPKMIAVHYIKSGRLFIDLLASIPLDSIPGLTFLEFLGLLKLMRIFRVPKLIQKVNLTETAKNSIKVLEVILLLVILYHITACIWYIVVDGTNEWIPPVNWIDFALLERAFYDRSVTTLEKQYLLALYYGVMGLNSGEIGARSEGGLIAASLIMFSGMFINALLFGTMAELILQLKRKERQVQESLDLANTAMMNLKLPMRQQREVVQYLMTIQSTQAQQEQLKNFEQLISPPLQKEVRIHIFHQMIIKNAVFMALIARPEIESDDFVFEAVQWLDIQLSEPENQIFPENATAQCIYFIAKGAVVIQQKSMVTRNYEQLVVLKQTCHFGEIGVIYNCPRTMRAQGQRYSTLAKLSRAKMLDMSQMYPTMVQEFKNHISSYKDPVKNTLEKLLPRVPLFKHLNVFDLNKVIFAFQLMSVAPKDMLFETNSPQQGMYVILDGFCTLALKTEGMDVPIKILRKGHIYGYDSLISPTQHKLSMMCMNYKLTKEKIKKRSKNGMPISSELLYDQEGNIVPINKSIFAKVSGNDLQSANQSYFSPSNRRNVAGRIGAVPGGGALDEIEQEGRAADQLKTGKRDSQMSLSPRIQERSHIQMANSNMVSMLPSHDPVDPLNKKNGANATYYTRKLANTAIAFLPNQEYQRLCSEINQLKDNAEGETKRIENSGMRPYIMDYYIPKRMPRTNQLMEKMRFITQKQGGRTLKYKFRNAVLATILSNRLVKKSQTIIERILGQINKQEAQTSTSYMELSDMFERSRTQRLTIRQAKTMPAELQINDFVHSTSEMHSKVNVILEQLDSLNKRMQTAKNNFDVTQRAVSDILGVDSLSIPPSRAGVPQSHRSGDVINQLEAFLKKDGHPISRDRSPAP